MDNQQHDEGKRVFVPLEWLQPGMRADCDVYAGLTRLLAEGTVITAGMLLSLRSRNIMQIEVKPESALAHAPKLSGGTPEARSQHALLLQHADTIYQEHQITLSVDPTLVEQGTQLIEELFAKVQHTGTLDTQPLVPLAAQLVRQHLSRPLHTAKLADVAHSSRYLFRHAVNTSLFVLAIAKDWFASPAELERLVLATLLHDAGMMKLDEHLRHRPSPLTGGEWDLVRQHPQWSAALGREAVVDEAARAIMLGHHERLDGSGYPGRLAGAAIHRLARLAAICDVYDAITSVRGYKPRLNFSRAVDIIVLGAGTQFDPALVHQFIRYTGRFPIGTFVQLSNGSTGVVKSVNPDALWRPVVALVLDGAGRPLPPGTELDLRQHEEYYIHSIIEDQPARGRSGGYLGA